MMTKFAGTGAPTNHAPSPQRASRGTYGPLHRALRGAARLSALVAMASVPAAGMTLALFARSALEHFDGSTWMPHDALVIAIAAGGALLCAYLTVIGVAMALGAARGSLPRWSTHAAPHAWRRIVAIGIGVSLNSTVPAAIAAPPDADAGWVPTAASFAVADALTATSDASASFDALSTAAWVVTPGESDAPPAPAVAAAIGEHATPAASMAAEAPAAAPATASTKPPSGGAEGSWRVGPGESLWSITSTLLGDTADASTIASAWPHLYDANRGVIGDDPGLIHPGQQLAIPAELTR